MRPIVFGAREVAPSTAPAVAAGATEPLERVTVGVVAAGGVSPVGRMTDACESAPAQPERAAVARVQTSEVLRSMYVEIGDESGVGSSQKRRRIAAPVTHQYPWCPAWFQRRRRETCAESGRTKR